MEFVSVHRGKARFLNQGSYLDFYTKHVSEIFTDNNSYKFIKPNKIKTTNSYKILLIISV